MKRVAIAPVMYAVSALFVHPAFGQNLQPFEEFPGVSCEVILKYDQEGAEENPIIWWVHGFVTGIHWVNRNDGPSTRPFVEIAQGIVGFCENSPDAMLSGSVMNRIYEIRRPLSEQGDDQ